jgi:hypothetical protein
MNGAIGGKGQKSIKGQQMREMTSLMNNVTLTSVKMLLSA